MNVKWGCWGWFLGGLYFGDVVCFWMSFNFFGTRIRVGALPRVPGVADWCGFFLFFGIWGGSG